MTTKTAGNRAPYLDREETLRFAARRARRAWSHGVRRGHVRAAWLETAAARASRVEGRRILDRLEAEAAALRSIKRAAFDAGWVAARFGQVSR